ncbi:DUF732 domain-containing protein [Mycolicibacterium arenosum]|uniref:DUF732 domain-containing protein n=1 Tax=Mycolicibacterium arenosum TaxID=2952157 RepID=A0ABT1M9G5_9MYCO|nr:DUF732 domain-containing protein [Mycolicibacterium sp. CAU 1645]MCP9275815.1 DUF732 domain-containing protein [Mycolicibacterium sp. CAU 1645]
MRLDPKLTAGLATGHLSLVACAALLTSGCGMDDGVITGMGITTSQSASIGSGLQSLGQPPGDEPALVVNPHQRAYLDALTAAGVRPSGELVALSIGSYVCQARAANQTDQAVWDFVLPMVRGDVRDSHSTVAPPPAGEVNSVTADYIRIATDKLC